MAKQRIPVVEIRDFPGLASRYDPDDTPPGAAVEQLNLTSVKPGRLVSRDGYRPVTFEEE